MRNRTFKVKIIFDILKTKKAKNNLAFRFLKLSIYSLLKAFIKSTIHVLFFANQTEQIYSSIF